MTRTSAPRSSHPGGVRATVDLSSCKKVYVQRDYTEGTSVKFLVRDK